MEKNKKLLITIIFVSIALIVCACINLYKLNVGTVTAFEFVSTYSLIATSLFGVYYMVSGCKKEDSALFFKIFMLLFALSQLVILFGPLSLPAKISSALAAILLLVLAFAKNLGEKNSLIIATLIVVVITSKYIGFINDLLNSKLLTMLLLSLATLVLVFAKYQDKANRNSK